MAIFYSVRPLEKPLSRHTKRRLKLAVKCLEHEIYAQGFVTEIEESALTGQDDCGRTLEDGDAS